MRGKDVAFIAIALVAGVALGMLFKSGGNQPIMEAEHQRIGHSKIGDAGESATIKALRAQISELKDQLRALSLVRAEGSNEVGRAASDPDKPPMNFRERMEQLKVENPARYAEMTNRWEGFRRMRAERYRNRCEFLTSIDTSQMSDQARKTHEEYQAAMAKSEELMEQMHNDNLTEEQRRQLMHEMHESRHELMELGKAERSNLFEETAKVLGFEGEDLKTISSTLSEIVESTESGRGFGPPPPGGKPGGNPAP